MSVVLTPQMITEVASMWRSGMSASNIAQKIGGISRLNVIDAVNRAGIGQTKFSVETTDIDNETQDTTFVCVETPEPEIKGIPFLEAAGSKHYCKWPLWDTRDKVSIFDKRVCGEKPVAGHSWCQHHFERHFKKSPPEERHAPLEANNHRWE